MNEEYGINLPSGIFRMLDASLNRAAEGLRVLEDVARMVLNEAELTHELKNIRHGLELSIPFRPVLLSKRDSQNDVGQVSSGGGSAEHGDIFSIVTANARRCEQALRTIEEIARLPDSNMKSSTFENMRFKLYSLEKDIVSRILRRQKQSRIKGLYVILDSTLLGGRSHMDMAKMLLEAGVKTIQLREKNMPGGKFLKLACSLVKLCDSNNAMLVINDHLDIALASGAGGLHLGQEDIPLSIARKHLPIDTIIGVSVDSVEQAKKAEQDGADYISPQAIFETHSKACPPIGLNAFRAIRNAVSIPIVAIGGINIDNIALVIEAGTDAVAVISSVTLSPEPDQVARELSKRFNQSTIS